MLEELLGRLFEQEPASTSAPAHSEPAPSATAPAGDPVRKTPRGPADHPDVLHAISALKMAKRIGNQHGQAKALDDLKAADNGAPEKLVGDEIAFEMQQAVRKGGYVNMRDIEKLHKTFWDWIAAKIETFDTEKGTFSNWIKYLSGMFARGLGWQRSTQHGRREMPDVDPKKYDLPKMEPYTDDERVVASVIHNYLDAVSRGSKPFPYEMKNATREKGKALVKIFLSYWGIGTPRVNGMALVSKYPELVVSRAALRQLMQTMAKAIEKYVQKETGRLGVSDPSGAFKGLLQKLSPLALGGLSKADPSIVAETAARMDDLLADLLSVYKAA